jgi:hypothetical protein
MNRVSAESMNRILTAQYNLKYGSCEQFHTYISGIPALCGENSFQLKYTST